MVEVLGVAVKKEIVMDYLECFRKAGLKISVVDIQPNAVLKLICHNSHFLCAKDGSSLADKNIAVMDMGNEKMSLTFIEDKKIFMNRTLSQGGRIFTGGDTDSLVYDKINDLATEIAIEINPLLDFFVSTSKNRQIDYMVLLGGGSLIPSMAKCIERAVSIKTESIDTLHNVGIKDLKSPDHIGLLANGLGAFIRRG